MKGAKRIRGGSSQLMHREIEFNDLDPVEFEAVVKAMSRL
jgi:hypothetical protein